MKDETKSILRLNKYLLKKNKWLYVSYGFMSLLWCFVPFTLAFLINLLMDDLSMQNGQRYFSVLAVYTVLTYVNIYYARKSGIVEAKITSYVEKALQLNVMHHVLGKKEHDCEAIGVMTDVLENDFNVLESMLLIQIEFLCNIISFLGSFVIVLQINLYLTFFGFLPIVLLSSLVGYFGEKLKTRFMDARETNIDFSVMTSDIVENYEIFQFLAERQGVMGAFGEKCRQRGTYKLRKSMYVFALNHSMLFVNNLSVLLILVLAAVFQAKAAVSVGALTLFINSINNGFSFLQLYNNVVGALKVTESSMERVCGLLHTDWKELPDVLTAVDEPVKAESSRTEEPVGITFHKFRMTPEDSLHEFSVSPGTLLAVSGGNSSGKSYFLECIMGYRTYEGEISFDSGEKPQIGLLPQENVLFDASLRENVTLFDKTECVEDAFVVSNFTGNVRNWNDHLEQSIGANGKRLSEGQRQRAAIARAVQNGRNLLVLDDPFLFLDKDNRKAILQNLKELQMTVIIATNDENIIRAADAHIILEERKIRYC